MSSNVLFRPDDLSRLSTDKCPSVAVKRPVEQIDVFALIKKQRQRPGLVCMEWARLVAAARV